MRPICLTAARPTAATVTRALALTLALSVPGAAPAATFGELSNGAPGGSGQMPYAAGPYASAPGSYCPPNCYPAAPAQMPSGAEGVPPGAPYDETPYIPPYAAQPRAYLPLNGYGDTPGSEVRLWSFGQINATTDPFDPWGFSTPYMYVPWSTPLAGWTNAATWNWWRERSGALPRNW